MILLDVNVVLATHREDHPHHAAVRPWFDALVGGGSPFCVPDVVWASFVRLATSSRIFEEPTPPAEAFRFMRIMRAQSGYVSVTPSEAHLDLFEDVCRDFDATGDLVPDAYLAAVAIDQAATLASLDRDFARFTTLRWQRPGD